MTPSRQHTKTRVTENVLVLQGGGSLGAFACGVFKALHERGIRFDMVGGTSIGAVNAAIICGTKHDDPVRDLEDFWIELAESSYNIFQDFSFTYFDTKRGAIGSKKVPASAMNALMFGVPALFVPVWQSQSFPWISMPFATTDWSYYYDHSPLAHTLTKYVDFEKLSKKNGTEQDKTVANYRPRLVATAVNVTSAEPLVFDSARTQIQPKHILASSAYSAYGFPWVEVEENIYAWDGSLLSNTPLKEIMEASPRNDKNVYIVENYPRMIDRLPADRPEVIDRTRDIIFSDKTIYDLRSWKHISRCSELIEKLYDIFDRLALDKPELISPTEASEIRKEYDALIGNFGAEILAVHRIIRNRMESPHILKNADFSLKTIKSLIRQGEEKTLEHLDKREPDTELTELLKLLYL